jgi:hypothetical protein
VLDEGVDEAWDVYGVLGAPGQDRRVNVLYVLCCVV